ncbi:MAG: hypothetical protein ABSB49_22475 [Polyangia bacterium]
MPAALLSLVTILLSSELATQPMVESLGHAVLGKFLDQPPKMALAKDDD